MCILNKVFGVVFVLMVLKFLNFLVVGKIFFSFAWFECVLVVWWKGMCGVHEMECHVLRIQLIYCRNVLAFFLLVCSY